MHRGSRRDRGAAATAAEPSGSGGGGGSGGRGRGGSRRKAGPLSSSTDTSGSSSCGDGGVGAGGGGGGSGVCNAEPSRTAAGGSVSGSGIGGGAQLRSDNLKDFKERVDSTIQQLSGLVSLLTSRESGVPPQPSNSSNRGDAACDSRASGHCCCQCHAPATTAAAGGEGRGGSGGSGGSGGRFPQSTVAPKPAHATATSSSVSTSRRQARSSREFSAAISVTTPRRQQVGDCTSDAANDSAATTTALASVCRRKPASDGSGGIRFLWYDAGRKRYAVRDAELICAKSVKRLHLCVHYFRVAGEDFLLLEKDCSDDGLAFIDTDNVVAFEGLSVEKVLKLQKLGCQLRPEELSREFAVEKGRSKYYVVPVEDNGGDWRLSDSGGAEKLGSLRRMLEQQEARKGGGGGGGGGGGRKGGTGTAA